MRTVIQHPNYIAGMEALCQRYSESLVDQGIRAIEWIVARDPESCHLIQGVPGVRLVKTDAAAGAPALRGFFRILDMSYCEILHVEEREPQSIWE